MSNINCVYVLLNHIARCVKRVKVRGEITSREFRDTIYYKKYFIEAYRVNLSPFSRSSKLHIPVCAVTNPIRMTSARCWWNKIVKNECCLSMQKIQFSMHFTFKCYFRIEEGKSPLQGEQNMLKIHNFATKQFWDLTHFMKR